MKLAMKEYSDRLLGHMDFNLSGRLLDVGCGDGSFTVLLARTFRLETEAIDVCESENWTKIGDENIRFGKSSIFSIPFKDDMFDHVFLKDILHHIDEPAHRDERFKTAFDELKRVCRPGGDIIILEPNRYNPIFYISMVRLRGHDHLRYGKIEHIVRKNFEDYEIMTFEAHVYPGLILPFFRIYDSLMDRFANKNLKSYTLLKIKNGK